jgi:hypothetical protein
MKSCLDSAMSYHKRASTGNLLPTRKELEAFLRSQGRDPYQLRRMSSWEQVQLTREYQQTMND